MAVLPGDGWLTRLVHKLDRLEEAGQLRAMLKRDPHTLAVLQVVVTPCQTGSDECDPD